MATPFTLFEFFGRPRPELDWRQTCLLLIDHQREYVDGALPLTGMSQAVAAAAELLARARAEGAPVLHVAHRAPAGAPAFAPERGHAAFIDALAPREGEDVVIKALPSAFAGTDLHARLQATGRRQLVIAGFMTHMCVSTSTRAAAELGYSCFVFGQACATRDLRAPDGERIAAAQVHRTALAELADTFACVLP